VKKSIDAYSGCCTASGGAPSKKNRKQPPDDWGGEGVEVFCADSPEQKSRCWVHRDFAAHIQHFQQMDKKYLNNYLDVIYL
jgi:hypothetical protein